MCVYICCQFRKTPSSPKQSCASLTISCAINLDTYSSIGVLSVLMGYHISAYLLLQSARMSLAPDKSEGIQFDPVCNEKGLRTVMLHLIWEDFTGTELTRENLITLFNLDLYLRVLFRPIKCFLYEILISPLSFALSQHHLVYRLHLLCRQSEVITQAYSLQNPILIHSEVKKHLAQSLCSSEVDMETRQVS